MNKEAIERTKARCKKEIRDRDRIYVLPGFYVKKPKIPEWEANVDYADGTEVMLNGEMVVVSGLNNHATLNPKEVGVIAPRYCVPYPNIFEPLSKKELIAVPVILCWLAALIYWWLS
jgi:hypothetical protein